MVNGILAELHLALNERAVEYQGEVAQAHEGKVLAYVQLEAEAVSALGVLVGVDELRPAGHGVSPLNGVAKVLVEAGQCDLVAA